MIKLENIRKVYPGKTGEVVALKHVDLEIARGEIFGIIGLSGAGKSTLIRCINLLERPTSGKVFVDGQDMTAMNAHELRQARKNIGMIFQHFNLLSSATVYDNIAFPLRLAKISEDAIQKRVTSLLDLVNLSDKASYYPAQLSGGQKQRVGIARALASEPKILLCDEATSALDPQTTEAILKLILDINEKLGITVVVITHEMKVIKDICDKVAVLENGVIAEQGTVLEVFTNPKKDITKEFIRVLYSNQLPAIFNDVEILQTPAEGHNLLIRLEFLGNDADEPVITRLVRNFNIEVSILSGQIDAIKNTPYGRMLVEISGDHQAIADALKYLKDINLKLEVIGYVR